MIWFVFKMFFTSRLDSLENLHTGFLIFDFRKRAVLEVPHNDRDCGATTKCLTAMAVISKVTL